MDLLERIKKRIKYHESEIERLQVILNIIKKEIDNFEAGELAMKKKIPKHRTSSILYDALQVLRKHPGQALSLSKIVERMPSRRGKKITTQQVRGAIWWAIQNPNSWFIKEARDRYRARTSGE